MTAQKCPPHLFTFDRSIFAGARNERSVHAVCTRCGETVSLDTVITKIIEDMEMVDRVHEALVNALDAELGLEIDYRKLIEETRQSVREERGYVEPVPESADS